MLEVKPISKPRTLLEWYKEQNKIDMEPSYQRRGDLWPKKNKQLLINSILNRYDIPKIYLADFTYFNTPLKESKRPFAVIDGKQRLTIFFEFLENKLQLDSTPIFLDGHELILGGQRYSDLKREHPSVAKQFEEFIPTVMSVISDNLEDVQELFIRLNLNVSISGPERRNAMPGPLPLLIRNLSVHGFFRNCAIFPINRGQDLNAAAKILLMEKRGGLTNTKKADLDRFVLSNKNIQPVDFERIYASAKATLDKMSEVFDHEDVLLKAQTQLPVYYWLIKNSYNNYKKQIRSFLIKFEKERGVVRAQASARAQGKDVEISDPSLLEYNNLVRSPDDRTKQEFMYKQLEDRLRKLVKS